jgi:hypothetical protein
VYDIVFVKLSLSCYFSFFGSFVIFDYFFLNKMITTNGQFAVGKRVIGKRFPYLNKSGVIRQEVGSGRVRYAVHS